MIIFEYPCFSFCWSSLRLKAIISVLISRLNLMSSNLPGFNNSEIIHFTASNMISANVTTPSPLANFLNTDFIINPKGFDTKSLRFPICCVVNLLTSPIFPLSHLVTFFSNVTNFFCSFAAESPPPLTSDSKSGVMNPLGSLMKFSTGLEPPAEVHVEACKTFSIIRLISSASVMVCS